MHLALGEPGRDILVEISGDDADGIPLGLWLPLDADLPIRLEAVDTFWRRLMDGRTLPPDDLTRLQRAYLIGSLRALDARLDGASIRDVAMVLFKARKLPSGRTWTDHHLRNRARRLIDNGLELMRGGYLALLRPPSRRR